MMDDASIDPSEFSSTPRESAHLSMLDVNDIVSDAILLMNVRNEVEKREIDPTKASAQNSLLGKHSQRHTRQIQ